MLVTNPTPEYEIVAPNEAIVAWKQNAVTVQVLDIIDQELQASSLRIGKGETLGDNIIQDTARAVGYVDALEFMRHLFELAFVVKGVEDDREYGDEQTEEDS
jgi:hypothetical protein